MRRLLLVVTICTVGASIALVPSLAAGQDGGEPVESTELTGPGDAAAPGYDETVPVAPEADLVGFQWDGDPAAQFSVEVLDASGEPTEQVTVGAPDGGPDPGTAEAAQAEAARGAGQSSEPLLVTDPSQVRVVVTSGTPEHVELVTVDGDGAPVAPAPAQASLTGAFVALAVLGLFTLWRHRSRLRRSGVVVTVLTLGVGLALAGCTTASGFPDFPPDKPPIRSRAGWGADEGLRRCGPDYAPGVEFAVVHHTVNDNGYGPGQSDALVRSIYVYHTQVNGWCDIGYNFLVDRYGVIFEGRFGGKTASVIGAHAAPFNTFGTGVAIIGNFQGSDAPAAAKSALIDLLVWKLSVHTTDPYTPVTRHGLTFDPIVGHRDVNQTACPGNVFYPSLGWIRDAVKPRVFYGSPRGAVDTIERVPGGVRVSGWAVDPEARLYPTQVKVVRAEGGVLLDKFYADRRRDDIGRLFGKKRYGSFHGFDKGVTTGAGTQTICVGAINISHGTDRLLGCKTV